MLILTLYFSFQIVHEPAVNIYIQLTGAESRIFIWRGGGGVQMIMCARTHIMSVKPTAGVQGPLLKGPLEALGGFWCSLVLSEPYF